jgi:hypothetical protein
MSRTSMAVTAQYMNFRQRKLGRGTIIIQTVHILQHDSADNDIGSVLKEDFFEQSKLLSNNPARQ